MRTALAIALAALLTACGGGSDSAPPQTKPPAGPACAPRAVTVALVGDSELYGWDGALQRQAIRNPGAQLQADMGARFGAGAVIVTNLAVPGTTAAQAPHPTADVIVTNFAVNDARLGEPVDQYAAAMAAIRPTIVMTALPIARYPSVDDAMVAPYLAVQEGLGVALVDTRNYVLSLSNWQGMEGDGLHPNESLYVLMVDNVLAPAVAKQVAPLRCQ